jgi:hypothetical protein
MLPTNSRYCALKMLAKTRRDTAIFYSRADLPIKFDGQYSTPYRPSSALEKAVGREVWCFQ